MNEFSKNSSENNPAVSVVMPAYNAGNFLREAVKSILHQTLQNWELIIVDDGSTDTTKDILSALRDRRIRVISHATNLGLPRSLNDAVSAARGTFVARLDADDVMRPERLNMQVSFLERYPEIGICGSDGQTMNDAGQYGNVLWRPRNPHGVKFLALWETPLLHPTILARTDILKTFPFDESYTRSEDYELWSRLLFEHGILIANISKPLTSLRQHQKSFTKMSGGQGLEFVTGIPLKNMSRYRTLTTRERTAIILYRGGAPMRIRDIAIFAFLISKLSYSFARKERPSLNAFPEIVRIALGTLWRAVKRSASAPARSS